MRHLVFLGLLGFFGFLYVDSAAAAYPAFTYRYQHHLFTIDPDRYPEWHGQGDVWTVNGQPVQPLPEWQVDGDAVPPLPAGVEKSSTSSWDEGAIRATLEKVIASSFNRTAGRVTIGKDANGKITFDGVGLTGHEVDVDAAVASTLVALQGSVTDIVLSVRETQPQVTVTDPELARLGIKEVVTVGESNFAGSPVNRRHNIAVGLSKFNGHLIPQGTVFSFGKVLGPVDGSTGYRKELVIKGDRTEPDYGGGLCQVSTTAYRGVWEYGFPIEQRKNHSYAVSYYGPQGTDATVYPPNPDMKFTNNGPSALLMQTHQEKDRAYFVYYGTRDKRTADVWGPIVLGTTKAPPDRTITTTALPPGVKRKVGDRHTGITTLWYRQVKLEDGTEKVEPVLSVYEARPLFYEVGVAAADPVIDINTPEPPRVF